MKINVELALNARKRKGWSQDDLAVASGLNLRTVQRIESDGSASLQSRKALASALDLDFHELEYQEIRMQQNWEYKVLEAKDRKLLQPELSGAGANGWELVPTTAMWNSAMMTSVVYTLFLKQPASNRL